MLREQQDKTPATPAMTTTTDKNENGIVVAEEEEESPSAMALTASSTTTTTTDDADTTVVVQRRRESVNSSSTQLFPSIMDEWFQQATPEECDAMSALQLEYRFHGDTMTMWWQVFQQVGFTYTSDLTYQPPSRRKPVLVENNENNLRTNNDDDNNYNNNNNDGHCHETQQQQQQQQEQADDSNFPPPSRGFQSNEIFNFLDLFAIPQLSSTLQDLPVIPKEFLKLTIDEQHWWRRLRDELLFRKFHPSLEPSNLGEKKNDENEEEDDEIHDMEADGATNNNNNKSSRYHLRRSTIDNNNNDNDDNNKNGKRKQVTSESNTTTSSNQRSTRQRTVTSSDKGADLVMRRPTAGKGTTKSQGNSRKDSNEDDNNNTHDDDDEEKAEPDIAFPTIQEYATQAKTLELLDVQTIEATHARNDFYEWRFLLTTNHSLLFYGLGSKRVLLNQFADQELSSQDGGDLLVLDGFDKEISIEAILDLIVNQWLDGISPEFSLYDIESSSLSSSMAMTQQQQQQQPPSSIFSSTRVGITYPHQGDRHVVQKAIAISRALAKVASRTLQPLYLIIHTIDGVALRNPSAQEALAALVFNSTLDNGMNAIRLVASVDHVNAPTVLWNSWTRASFRWTWKAIHTYRPYIEETTNSTFVDKTSRKPFKTGRTSRRGSGIQNSRHITNNSNDVDEDDDEADEANIFHILSSLAPRHTEVIKRLSELQLAAYDNEQQVVGGGGEEEDIFVDYIDLFRECQDHCIVTNDQQLRNFLKELCDQEIVEKKQTGSSVKLLYRIPYSKSKLKQIQQFR